MDHLGWLIPVAIAVFALLNRSGSVKRGLSSLQRQIAEAQLASQAAQAAGNPATIAPAPVHPPMGHRPARRSQPAPAPPAFVHLAARAPVATPGGRALLAAFADPAHARTAVVLAEILAPPVALR